MSLVKGRKYVITGFDEKNNTEGGIKEVKFFGVKFPQIVVYDGFHFFLDVIDDDGLEDYTTTWFTYFAVDMTRIYINKNPKARQPFSVSYYSRKRVKKTKQNPVGLELLSRSEDLPTRDNCLTNIRSQSSIFQTSNGIEGYVAVLDNTGKEPKEILVKIKK